MDEVLASGTEPPSTTEPAGEQGRPRGPQPGASDAASSDIQTPSAPTVDRPRRRQALGERLAVCTLVAAVLGVLIALAVKHSMLAAVLPPACEVVAVVCGLGARRLGAGRLGRVASLGRRLAIVICAIDVAAIVVIPHLLGSAASPRLPVP